MAGGNFVRRLRGALGNALVWGLGWFTLAFVVITIVRLTGNAPAGSTWDGALRTALMFSVMGTIAGTAFSTFIGLRYQGRQVGKISWVRFGIGGAVVTGLFVPVFISIMRLLSGEAPLALTSLLRNGLVGFVFGGAAAAGSIKLAQFATRPLPGAPDDDADALAGEDRKSVTDRSTAG